MSLRPAIVVLGPSGTEAAARIKAALPQAEIHGRTGRVDGMDVDYEDLGSHLVSLFREGRPIVGVCAAGVLVRLLAPQLKDKVDEPPVLAVAEDLSVVVPLLGGHRGGNDIGRRIAESTGAIAAVTTAGDLRFGVALDEPPKSWRLANPEHVKAFTASLLAGEKVRLEGDAPWLADSALPVDPSGRLRIIVSSRRTEGSVATLVYYPAVLAVGVGCERGVHADELCGLVAETLDDAGLATDAVAGVFSIDVKLDEAAVHAVADWLGVPVQFFDAKTLEAETPRLENPSDLVFREVGCHGVAEAGALAAAGPRGQLVVPKKRSRRATCAVAEAPEPIDAARMGRGRGHLAVVGLGPGAAAMRTPEASIAITGADDIVGYARYLDLAGPLPRNVERHAFALGEEEARVRAALDLAARGRRVALVSSGDAGIYAMASLVFELIDREACVDWRSIAIEVIPGVSALQAAAARAGAPLGHDFCSVSLSDLLTPWHDIARRLEAAARGDFVVALYNPVSQRRRAQLEQARDILLRHRAANTPVVLARNLGREGESVRLIELQNLGPDDADMLTLVLVGSSRSRLVRRDDGGAWLYTPRGYLDKGESDKTNPESAA